MRTRRANGVVVGALCAGATVAGGSAAQERRDVAHMLDDLLRQ